MNYDDLREETKLFLNKAMDIYATIADTILELNLTTLDRKVLALLIAGFLINGNLKEIFSKYDDIKLDDLFKFIEIKEWDITSIKDGNYKEFFDNFFKLDLIDIINNDGNEEKKINFITPEVIVASIPYYIYSSAYHTVIHNYFAREHYTSRGFMGTHPVFSTLKQYTISDGSVSWIDENVNKKDSPKENNIKMPSPSITQSFNDSKQKKYLDTQLSSSIKPSAKTTINLDDENVWLLLDEIQKKFIGQEKATEDLFYNIVNNQQLAEMEDLPDGERSIIFMDGPTGTGKTAITREITKKLGIPFASSSITNYSSTGYVGGNITDVLEELYKKANNDLEKAQRGIIVFDEFDKITYSGSRDLEMKKAVQQQLLDFLGGGKYNISVGDKIYNREEIEFDTSKLTFVCLGALTDLRTKKTETKRTIGFGQTIQSPAEQNYSITPQDLMSIGLEPELVGRFNTYLHTDEYNKEALEKILRESTISPLIGFKKWIETRRKQLVVYDDVYSLIAEQAYELNTGARSLQTIMNNIRTQFIREVLRGTSDTIYLDSETVIKVNNQTINRKGRG